MKKNFKMFPFSIKYTTFRITYILAKVGGPKIVGILGFFGRYP